MRIKNINILSVLLLLLLTYSSHTNAQNTSLRERLERKQQLSQPQQDKSIPGISVRANMLNQEQEQDLSNASWIREIYRYVDLTKGRNAALYYPVQPEGKRMNLFTMLFKLVAMDQIPAYQFIDATREVFDESALISFKDILEKMDIPYQEENGVVTYDDYSIPSNEVQGYYVKEAWYFDQTNSVIGTKIIAICPVQFRQEDYGIGSNRYPQFWVLYDDLRPYAARMPIMTSDVNNVMNKTINDFFSLHLFNGEIYKTANMENKVLTEIYKSKEEVEQAQKNIEAGLKQFEQNLWVTNDSTYIKTEEERGDKKKEKSKTKKAKTASSTPEFSARDRRM